ncbi:response regulator [Lysinibacillus yapensis]|uniref:histidine kinase n=1 Tax=Ureibacillus yapensis TaxID=2304605 RepID=A0A396SU04_9BACL|nr:ATP-binding protein [Lysinibacillus yapensis]RHW39971.1 response regulator [Lysinibacillus yapensis]
MEIIRNINHSLARKVLALMSICLFFFAIGCGSIFYYQHKMQDEYIQQQSIIKEKQQITNTLFSLFNSDFLIMQDSIAFKVPASMEDVLKTETVVKQNLEELNRLIGTEEEELIYQEFDGFTSYYFATLIPLIMNEYEKNQDPSIDLHDNSVTYKVKEFLEQNRFYENLLEEKLTDLSEELAEKQSIAQKAIIIFSIFVLILSILVIQRILASIGKPLANFTFAANEIAAGRDAMIEIDENRQDELGVLSVAFKKMMNTIQDKEQSLVAHNEELIAQQEELQAQQEALLDQQSELQNALATLTDKDQKLMRRNQLIKHISTSLNKTEVLQSIIENMCKITESDKGIFSSVLDDAIASYGISDFGVEQFRNNMDNDGLIHRLNNEKKPFTVKRLQHPIEKGYHETSNYSFDLYLPIISSSYLAGVIVLSRYGDPYSENELSEYETLVKQVAIYLEKISLFEQSENDRRLNQDIINTVQEGIQLIDTEHNIIQINKPLSEIFEWSETPERIIGLPWGQWSHIMAGQIQEQEFIQNLENLIQSSFLSPDEEHSFIYRKNNSNQVIEVYCRTIKYCNEHIGTLLVHRNITKEYELSQMKSEFVSTVSHELRTPLASVLGFTELLLTKELKPERKIKYLQTIYNESKRLTALINDFLDIQRMESGKQTYEKNFIDITSILKNVIELQEVNTSLHEIKLSIELEETIILGDKNKIKQVFTNLLSNAIKYSPEGGNILIRIYGDNQNVSIDIKDEGLGIPEDSIPNLFQQFYRVDNSDRRKIGGTGLGLAIVQEIAKAHGGKVTVSSEYGKGSTFTTQFPKTSMKANKDSVNDKETSMLNYSIMVIEDDLSLAELLNHELQESGFHVNFQNSGQKALEQMRKETPDAIVLDIMLSDEIDGWTIMKQMKETKKLANIPIFVSTALEEKERGFSLGAQDYLIKPYKPSHLSELIKQTLKSNEKNGQILMPH